ncbi:MAG: hypothetical protein J6U14_03640 [Bacteroidaceae bacterium]|nr:hypothetical protein [Bacteroidaceae bacterium]
MKARGFIGMILVVASILKLATMWGIMHLSWLDRVTEDPWGMYFAIFILIFVGINLIISDLKGGEIRNKYLFLKIKGIIGILLVVPSLLKLANMWGLIHINWLDKIQTNPLEIYVAICVMLYLGIWLIIDGFIKSKDQWLQRPLPISEEGKRISCSVSLGGDEYIYHGEPFHGAYLTANCGGIRMDLRNATITEDEEIDIRTCFGGVELFVPTNINIEVKSRSFIGSVGNKTFRCTDPKAPCLHIIASNILGGVTINN